MPHYELPDREFKLREGEDCYRCRIAGDEIALVPTYKQTGLNEDELGFLCPYCYHTYWLSMAYCPREKGEALMEHVNRMLNLLEARIKDSYGR